MVVAVHQANTVGAYECRTVLLAGVEYALLQHGARLGLLAEARRYNNERAGLLVACQQLHVVGTELGSHHQHGHIRRWQFACIVESLDSLHFLFFGVDDAQGSAVTATQQVAHDGAPRLVCIVRAANDDNALRIQ